MKSCPTCHRQYYDETLRFCLDDGTPLVGQLDPTRAGPAADATLHLPDSHQQPPTVRSTEPSPGPRSTMTSVEASGMPAAAIVPPTYPPERRRSGALLWLLGAVIIGVAAVAVAFIVTRNRSQDSNNVNQMAAASPAPSTNEPVATSSPANPELKEIGAATPTETQRRIPTPSPMNKPPTEKEIARQTEPVRELNSSKDEPPAPPVKAPPRSPISGGVLNGKATNLVKPAYPPAARAVRASGAVNVQVLIDEHGNVISAHAVSGHPLLQAAAVGAARASKFSPTLLSGQPVKVSGVIVYNFVAQ